MGSYLLRVAIAGMLLVLALILVRTYQGYQGYKQVRGHMAALSANVENLRGEIKDLESERARLADDMSYYEQLGREELGMIRPDELVFIVPLRD